MDAKGKWNAQNSRQLSALSRQLSVVRIVIQFDVLG
jgi:hypothetical protein